LPGSGILHYADVEAWLIELGGHVDEHEGSRGSDAMTMQNTMTIDGYRAVISFDPELQMFRGEFLALNGGADFYAKDVKGLQREGKLSLKVFLDACTEDGVEPRRVFSGKFSLRVDPSTHEAAAHAAAAHGLSLNQWAEDVLRRAALAQ
jgi:predicted HicB family RNase H-like nuclease